MQGLNTPATVYRAVQGTDDAAGGAQYHPYNPVVSVRCRIANRPATIQMRAQGMGTDLLFDVLLQPADADVKRDDLLVPTEGVYALKRFLVTGVQKSSQFPARRQRKALKLQVERWDDGKVVELL